MDRRELDLAARRVTYLRGLQLLPLAGLILWGQLRPYVGIHVTGWVDLGVLLSLVASAFAVQAFYVRTYGRVAVSNGRFLAARALLLVGFLGGAWLDLRRLGNTSEGLSRVAHDHRYDHHINLMILLASLSVLLWYRISVELRTDHLIVWGALIVLSLVPVWHRGSSASANPLPGLVALAIAVTGVADHLALRRSFRARHAELVDG